MAKQRRGKYRPEVETRAGYIADFDAMVARYRRGAAQESADRVKLTLERKSPRTAPSVTILGQEIVFDAKRSSRSIRQTLADRLKAAIETAHEEHIASGKPAMRTVGGKRKMTGTLIDRMRTAVGQTMEPYTKNAPRLGMPRNVLTIVTTELRSAISNGQAKYMKRYQEKHPDAAVRKQWIQHKELSKIPRTNHAIIHKRFVAVNRPFRVPRIGGGFDLMDYPHAPGAPLDQKINCHCQAVYTVD